MNFGLSVLLATSMILCSILYSKIYIFFKYQRNGSEDYVAVQVYAFRKLLFYSMEIPMIKLTGYGASIWLVSKIKAGHGQEKTKINREKRFLKNSLRFFLKNPSKLRRLLYLFRFYAQLYRQITEKIIKSFICEKMEWKTVFGTENAALAGIGTGVLWTTKGFILTRLKKQVHFNEKPQIHIHTRYGQDYLMVDLQCIFSIRIGNVINAMRSLYTIKR